ncbi:condensation domain-containing protein [Nocardia sp. NPDC060220]|uniref:condensation domain-containing protein n=1 Tax=Nocardia sp. NPDC060220 TaxID=3347076 RepID=UPI003668BE79
MNTNEHGGTSEPFDITPGQAEVIFLHTAVADLSMPISIRYLLRGNVDPEAMIRALTVLVDSNETLRVKFERDGESVRQRVMDRVSEPNIIARDVGSASVSEMMRYSTLLLRTDAISWNIWSGPPYRFHLIRNDAGVYLLLLTFQHSVVNARSVSRMETELFRAYAAVDAAPATREPRLRSAIEAQRQSSAASASAAAYWSETMRELANSTVAPRVGVEHRSVGVRLHTAVSASVDGRNRMDRPAAALSCYADFLGQGRTGTLDRVAVDMHFEHHTSRYRDVAGMFSVQRPVVIDRSPHGANRRAVADRIMETMRHKAVDSALLRNLADEHQVTRENFADFNYVHSEPTGELAQPLGLEVERSWFTPRHLSTRPARLQVKDYGTSASVVLTWNPDM